MASTRDRVHCDNLQLNRDEYFQQHAYLQSWPRCLAIVLGNGCNIDCPHCYQAKNGDNLLQPAEIGQELRREFLAFYPYLITLRIHGGEVFALRGFQELLDDVAATVRRPILSISTNGTLIGEEWAERIVRTPFSNVTFSIDGATPDTFNRLRRGANLECVLTNLRRIRTWKEKLNSELPYLDSFFVIMRSNFREIPQYLELMSNLGVTDVSLQTVEINDENRSRVPGLARDEVLEDAAEVSGLHDLLRAALPRYRGRFRMIRLSGLRSLFEAHGLDSSFLLEGAFGLCPDSDDLRAGGERESSPFELCPNPWTTLFVTENGNVHLCFLSAPIGNLYETPLAALWNSPAAVAKRSRMIAGHYSASGCSTLYCSWREGRSGSPRTGGAGDPRVEIKELDDRLIPVEPQRLPQIGSVRRLLSAKERRIAELEAALLNRESDFRRLDEIFRRYRRPILVRAASRMSKACQRMLHQPARAGDPEKP